MSRILPLFVRAIALAILMTSAFADVVTLKNGDRLQGKITKETDTDIRMAVKVSAGVTDEQILPRSTIEKIEKQPPDLEAYEALAGIQLGTTSFAVAQYDPYIRALEAFLAQFPNSVRASDAQTTLEAFKAEKKRVAGGEVKIEDQWLSRAQVEKERVQIGGRLAYSYMKSQSAAGDYVGALNTFAAMEKTYPGAAIFPDAVELARQVMPVLKTAVDRAIPQQKAMKDVRDKGIAAAGATDRAEMTAAVKKEQDANDAKVAADEASGKWPPFIPNNEKSLTTLLTHVAKDSTRIGNLPVDKMRQSLTATETAQQTLTGGDFDAALVTLKDAIALWKDNELAIRLTKAATALKDRAAKNAAVTPTPSTPTIAASKIVTPRPSAALAAAATPAASSTAVAAKTQSSDDAPFYMTIPGMIGIVVALAVVLVGANVLLKMKKRKAEQPQS